MGFGRWKGGNIWLKKKSLLSHTEAMGHRGTLTKTNFVKFLSTAPSSYYPGVIYGDRSFPGEGLLSKFLGS